MTNERTKTSEKMTRFINVNTLLWLALILALAGSLKHLAAIFASIDGDVFMGWVQAIAIDAGLFALAYSIKVRKVTKRSVRPLWFGVSMFTVISIYGNLAYGLLSTSGSLPLWMETIRPIVLAASLPILVLFLSELLSDDRQHANQVAEKEAKRVAKTELAPQLLTINEQRQIDKAQKMDELTEILRVQPDTPNTQLAVMLDVSRATIGNYRKELNGSVK